MSEKFEKKPKLFNYPPPTAGQIPNPLFVVLIDFGKTFVIKNLKFALHLP